MGWRIIYIEEAMSVRLYLDNIKIARDSGDLTIPLSDIHTLIIDNQQISISVPLINKCTEYNINFIICSLEHMPQGIINPFSGNYQHPLMLKKQIDWSIDMKLYIHKCIIRNKIQNQADLLKNKNKSRDVISKLIDYSHEVIEGDQTNREGLSAKMYFRELFGCKFKRFEDDVINAGLNYGYSILRSQISKTIISKGLTPCIGIIHKGYDNPFNLSDDIIEVFRPIIDAYVYDNLLEAIIFKKENRIGLIKQTSINVIYKNTKQTLFNAISMYIDSILYIFETGDLNGYERILLPGDL